MKKIILMLLAMAALPLAMLADASCDSVPSNYGGWVNLTDGYTGSRDYNHPKMEVAYDGSTIHLCWVEQEKVDNIRNICYRRSTDSGQTWEDARIVMQVYETYWSTENGRTKLMAVADGKVHIAAIHDIPTTYDGYKREGSSRVLYIRSLDGGATFSEPQPFGEIVSEYYRYDNCFIQCDGSNLVIAAKRGTIEGKHLLYFFYSTDGGESFTDLTHTIGIGDSSERAFLDLQMSGSRFAAMYYAGSWYSGLIEGNAARQVAPRGPHLRRQRGGEQCVPLHERPACCHQHHPRQYGARQEPNLPGTRQHVWRKRGLARQLLNLEPSPLRRRDRGPRQRPQGQRWHRRRLPLLLTFDGTLQDQSQYGNDAVALKNASLIPHGEIGPAGIASPIVDELPASTGVYTIDGRKLDSTRPLPAGIYIYNGQKIYIK